MYKKWREKLLNPLDTVWSFIFFLGFTITIVMHAYWFKNANMEIFDVKRIMFSSQLPFPLWREPLHSIACGLPDFLDVLAVCPHQQLLDLCFWKTRFYYTYHLLFSQNTNNMDILCQHTQIYFTFFLIAARCSTG